MKKLYLLLILLALSTILIADPQPVVYTSTHYMQVNLQPQGEC